MYRAKQSGGGRYEIFDKHLEVSVTSQQERERELRSAVEKRQFAFQYQPIYRLADGKSEGFESLSPPAPRRRNDGGLSASCSRWPKTAGLSILLGRETLDAACAQIRSLERSLAGAGSDLISINLTRHGSFIIPI